MILSPRDDTNAEEVKWGWYLHSLVKHACEDSGAEFYPDEALTRRVHLVLTVESLCWHRDIVQGNW